MNNLHLLETASLIDIIEWDKVNSGSHLRYLFNDAMGIYGYKCELNSKFLIPNTKSNNSLIIGVTKEEKSLYLFEKTAPMSIFDKNKLSNIEYNHLSKCIDDYKTNCYILYQSLDDITGKVKYNFAFYSFIQYCNFPLEERIHFSITAKYDTIPKMLFEHERRGLFKSFFLMEKLE